MSLLPICTQFWRLAIWLLLAIAPALLAAEPASEFMADLLHVAAPIQVTPDAHVSRLSAPREQGPVKATISPQVWCSSNTLQGKVFDVSTALRQSGITLPKGSRALYSPESQLLYIHSTHDDVEKAKVIFYDQKPVVEFTVDVKVIVKFSTREETLLDIESVPLVPEREMKFSTSGQESLRLTIMPYVWTPLYDEALHVYVDAEVRSHGKLIAVKNTWLTHHAKPVEAMLGKLGDATVTLSIQTHHRQGRWGVDAESEKEGKSAAIQEIQKALERPK